MQPVQLIQSKLNNNTRDTNITEFKILNEEYFHKFAVIRKGDLSKRERPIFYLQLSDDNIGKATVHKICKTYEEKVELMRRVIHSPKLTGTEIEEAVFTCFTDISSMPYDFRKAVNLASSEYDYKSALIIAGRDVSGDRWLTHCYPLGVRNGKPIWLEPTKVSNQGGSVNAKLPELDDLFNLAR